MKMVGQRGGHCGGRMSARRRAPGEFQGIGQQKSANCGPWA